MTRHSWTTVLITGVAAVALSIVICLTGCATANSGTTTSASDTNSAVQGGTITTRTVTFPKIYFQDKSTDEITSGLESLGCTDVTPNDDGSYTATMPLDKYNEFVDKMHTQVKSTLDAMPNSDSFPNISSITYDEQFSNITINLSVNQLGLQDMFDGYGSALVAIMYQQIAGQPVKCNVTVVGSDGSTLASNVYPDDMQKTSATSTAS